MFTGRRRIFFHLGIFLLAPFSIWSQERPKLVIGIVVDQMSNNYIYRFWNDFGAGGFKKLIQEGAYAPNTFYSYVPTYTGPGHASIYTGTTPSMHGIVANDWYDRKLGKMVYCVDDPGHEGVRKAALPAHKSPRNLIGATIGDMLKLDYPERCRYISIAIKDRSAILPGGATCDFALWWDQNSGKWMGSDYYPKAIPSWLKQFESDHPAGGYLQTWDAVKPKGSSHTDHNEYEDGIGTKAPAFPYNLKELGSTKGIKILKYTPFGNTYTFDLARAAIENEKLGSGDHVDFLAISLSSTDYIGHAFGPYSDEVSDTYIRLDRDLASFLEFVEIKAGADFVIFLTADHGIMPNIGYLKNKGLDARSVDLTNLRSGLEDHLNKRFHCDSLIEAFINNQVYLSEGQLKRNKLNRQSVEREVAGFLSEKDFILDVVTSHDLRFKEYIEFPKSMLQKGYMPNRSGDILFLLKPYAGDASNALGAEHGSANAYDTSVPLVWYGKGIGRGVKIYESVDISQIAPTLADILSVQRPPLCTAKSLIERIR